ncbi:MAG: helicase associated domain-containing protein [Candidatus Micrarchaeia archaeon]|jgi:hypothetical protein
MLNEKTRHAPSGQAAHQPLRAGFSHRLLKSGPAAMVLAIIPPNPQPAKTWHSDLSAYLGFKARKGTPSQYSADPGECYLAKWASWQRKSFRDGTLPSDKIMLLLEAGFDFQPKKGRQPGFRTTTHIWGRSFENYFNFLGRLGEPCEASDDILERSLAGWAGAQRKAFREGTLSDGHKEALMNAGFDFGPADAAWGRMFRDFVSFVTETGRLPAYHAGGSREKTLYGWRIRQFAARSRGTLSVKRMATLCNFLFFDLFSSCPLRQSKQDGNWERALNSWLSFRDEHGKGPRQKTKNLEECSLGRWGRRQRYLFKHGQLDSTRAKRLAYAGFDFRVKNDEGK